MPPAVPDSLVRLLSLLRPAFTAPSFDTFCWLVHGFVGRVGEHTITGVWQAARLAGVVHHSRAHDFFARRRWSADRLGLALAELVVAGLCGPAAPIRVAIDDTVFSRSGAKVFAAAWHFDSAAPLRATRRLGFGNSFVCLGILVTLWGRTICLPLLFRLWRPADDGAEQRTRVDLAHELVALVRERFAPRRIELCADSYYANRKLAALPDGVSACVRLRSNAVVWEPAPPPQTPRRGRPRVRGERLGSVRELAALPKQRFTALTLRRCGSERRIEFVAFDCIWYRVLGPRPVRLVIARDRDQPDTPPLALLLTDRSLSPEQIIALYAERWAIEVAFAEAKGQLGVGQARNRVQPAVERTVPFGFLCRALVIIWYALNGDPDADVQRRRATAPWYRQKRQPAFEDMLHALRRELIRAEFLRRSPPPPTRHKTTTPRTDISSNAA
jgi:hypothetical protein